MYSSISENNGVMGYTNLAPTYKVDEEIPFYVVFGDHTRSFNIANVDFCVMDNVKVLRPLHNNTLNELLFIISAWKNGIADKGYARHWSTAKEVKIQLPIQNGKIDFQFMECFVAELEAQRVAELEAYLTVTGLKDYELSDEEKYAIENISQLEWKELYATEVFDVKNTKNILSSEIEPNSGRIPYLCASADNNSISSYVDYKDELKDKGNCIFIGGKTFVVSYQELDFFSNDSHNLALYLKDEVKADKINQLYLSTCVRKSLGHKYSWGDSISNKKIQKDKIMLPSKNGSVDYSTMSTLISAVQKLVIKDVVLYAYKKIGATMQATNIKEKN